MEEISILTKVFLFLLFCSFIAYSYYQFEERREPIKRFSAALDFSDTLKNNLLCVRTSGTPNPGLLDIETLQKVNYKILEKFWNKPYQWEVVIRDSNGAIVYEEGDLKKEGKDHIYLANLGKEYTVVQNIIAIKSLDRSVHFGKLEVWVWDT